MKVHITPKEFAALLWDALKANAPEAYMYWRPGDGHDWQRRATIDGRFDLEEVADKVLRGIAADEFRRAYRKAVDKADADYIPRVGYDPVAKYMWLRWSSRKDGHVLTRITNPLPELLVEFGLSPADESAAHQW